MWGGHRGGGGKGGWGASHGGGSWNGGGWSSGGWKSGTWGGKGQKGDSKGKGKGDNLSVTSALTRLNTAVQEQQQVGAWAMLMGQV